MICCDCQQHFHNKSYVINCYWFKFKPNTKIKFDWNQWQIILFISFIEI